MKFVLIISMFALMMPGLKAQDKSVLIIAGGHSFDTLAFMNLFDRLSGFDYDLIYQPGANRSLTEDDISGYDVLVFYDMWQQISEAEKEAYLRMTETGVPMLFLHHSLVSYQHWPDFEQIIGGKYVQPSESMDIPQSELSTYKHDVWMNIEIANTMHPVTREMKNFRIFDEVYGNYRVGENVKPLLRTNHPESTSVIAWENQYNNSTIIYIQPGHGKEVYEDANYRVLIERSLKYLAKIH